MSVLKTLIEQHQAYLHLQKQISKAIHNRDERLLAQLQPPSYELFLQIESNRKDLVNTIGPVVAVSSESDSEVSRLVQLIEQARQMVQENEEALQTWLGQMKTDIQHYRRSQSKRGVLATYIQQNQATPRGLAEFQETIHSPSHLTSHQDVIPSSSPWAASQKGPNTVGHQINRRS